MKVVVLIVVLFLLMVILGLLYVVVLCILVILNDLIIGIVLDFCDVVGRLCFCCSLRIFLNCKVFYLLFI